jgi:hypothetical protein
VVDQADGAGGVAADVPVPCRLQRICIRWWFVLICVQMNKSNIGR